MMRVFISIAACALALGSLGCDGAAGKDGEPGAKGDDGAPGANGAQGEQGIQGQQGAQGEQGIQGQQGEQGEQGEQGVQGEQGEQGVQGEQGEQGTQGEQGEQGLPGVDWPGPVPAEYAAADGIRGGAAYNEWFSAAAGGDGTLAAYAVTVGAEFTRCKTCHAWDGIGNMGSYADRTGLSTGTATRPDVSNANLRATAATTTYQELYDLIAAPWGRPMNAASDNRHPDYTGYLDDAQVWDLVKFMREEWVNPNELYDLTVAGPPMQYRMVDGAWTLIKPTLTYTNIGKDGDATAGNAIHTAKCAACHGTDGKTVTIEGMSLGRFVRTKPHESWFKVKFGQASGGMLPGLVTATKDLKDLYKAYADATDFPD